MGSTVNRTIQQSLIAFFKITDADTYLRATVAGTPVESAMAFKKYPCMEFGCVEGFDNPKDLVAHYEAVHESTEAAAQPVAGAAPAAERLSAMLEQKTAGYKHVPGEVKARYGILSYRLNQRCNPAWR